MAGINGDRATYSANLTFARNMAAARKIRILIEPINCRDAPEYFLNSLDEAVRIAEEVGAGISIMFDCYHLQIMGGDLLTRYRAHSHLIGHVQFAGVPDRGEPNTGEVNFGWLLPQMRDSGHAGYFGAEYKPRGDTSAGLGWLDDWRGF